MTHLGILLSLITQQYGPAEYDLQDWLDQPSYQDTYCDSVTERCDLFPAYADADAECGLDPPVPGDGVGCTIRFPAGHFRWSQVPEVCRSHSLIAAGGDADTARTVLFSDANVGCFSFRSFGYCESVGNNDGSLNGWAGSGGAELIGIACVGDVATATTNVIAVFNESGANITRSLFRRYVQGLVYDAGATRPGIGASNANVFLVEDVHLWNMRHAGFTTRGPDANAFTAIAVDAIDNCQDSSWDATLGPCAQVDERSFLGGVFLGLHIDLGGGNALQLGNDANSRSMAFGTYIEGQQDVSTWLNTQVFGAIGGRFALSDGLVFLNKRPNGLEFVNTHDPDNQVTLRVGDLATASSAWEATATTLPGGFGGALRLKARSGTPQVWGWNIGNLSPLTDAMQVVMTATTGLPAGTLLVP